MVRINRREVKMVKQNKTGKMINNPTLFYISIGIGIGLGVGLNTVVFGSSALTFVVLVFIGAFTGKAIYFKFFDKK